MIINFTKMHSLGNDFIIIDAITQNIKLNGAYIKKIADRHVGIGCDQIIILEPPINPSADFYYKVYNADGKSADQCLNGVRCAARFALDIGLIKKSSIIAESVSGKIVLTVDNNSQVVIANLGIIQPNIHELSFKMSELNTVITLYNLSIGNNHAICVINNSIINNDFANKQRIEGLEHQIENLDHQIEGLEHQIEDLDDQCYSLLADKIANNKELFPQGVNIGFAKLLDDNKIQLRVFERGSGETLACGSNAVAAFWVAKHLNLINDQLDIVFKLGNLNIKLLNEELITQGPVNSIFCGKFKI